MGSRYAAAKRKKELEEQRIADIRGREMYEIQKLEELRKNGGEFPKKASIPARGVPEPEKFGKPYAPTFDSSSSLTQGEQKRIAEQTKRFNEIMRKSQIQRGVIPSGGPVSRADKVLSGGQIDARRLQYQRDVRNGVDPSIAKRLNLNTSGTSSQTKSDIFAARAEFEHNSPRAQAARERNAQRLQGIKAQKEERASYFRNKNLGRGQGFFNTPPTGQQVSLGQPTRITQPTQTNQSINPKIMEEFNAAVNKLANSKLELAISGTVDVRIIEGNISKSVEGLFQTAVAAYVDNKVTEAINAFASQNGIPTVPKPVGVKKE